MNLGNRFSKVIRWRELYGVPQDERRLQKPLNDFLRHVELTLEKSALPEELNWSAPAFFVFEFKDETCPEKWEERLRQLDARPERAKEPQTIGYWIERFLKRQDERANASISIRSAANRRFKLKTFSEWADHAAHITNINNHYVNQFHAHLAKSKLSRETKKVYFSSFQMFVRWCCTLDECELQRPKNLESSEHSFREPEVTGRKRELKKGWLWTKDEFQQAIKLPQPYRTFVLLYLNCGMVLGRETHGETSIREKLIWSRRIVATLRAGYPVD